MLNVSIDVKNPFGFYVSSSVASLSFKWVLVVFTMLSLIASYLCEKNSQDILFSKLRFAFSGFCTMLLVFHIFVNMLWSSLHVEGEALQQTGTNEGGGTLESPVSISKIESLLQFTDKGNDEFHAFTDKGY